MRLKKRKKRSRLRGRRTAGWGARKKHRGKGSRGGKGMAGTGKRAGQKRIFIIKHFPKYFGKRGFVSKKKKFPVINLDQIQEKLQDFLAKKIAKKVDDGIELNLEKYKILSRGEIREKLFIKAASFSEEARKKIEKAGGKAIKCSRK